MKDSMFNFIGSGSTGLALVLNVYGWMIDNNINMILAILVSFLSVVYLIIKITDKITDLKYKFKNRKNY